MMLFLHLVHTVKTSGDVNVSEGTIGAVVGPGAHIGQASFVSQLHSPSKNEGVYLMHLSAIYFNIGRERDRLEKIILKNHSILLFLYSHKISKFFL